MSTIEITGDSNMIDSKLFEDIESAPLPQGREAGDETRNRRLKLCEVAQKGNWNMDEDILNQFQVEDILAKISVKGNTALHIAAAAACSEFGIKLLELEQINYGEYLLAKNDAGNTAFWVAAASGNVELARKMLEENSDLASIRGREDLPYKGRKDKLPLYMAAVTGRGEMVNYLYDATKDRLRSEPSEDLIELLVTLIERALFDVAVKLVKDQPQIATASDKNQGIWETIFKSISRFNLATNHPQIATGSDKNQGIWKTISNCLSKCNIYEVAPEAFEELVELLLEEVMRLVDSKTLLEIIRKPMFAAADQGNEKFLKTILRKYPDLIFEVDENNYSLFHFAVMNRHINIFRLIDENCSSKDLLTKNTDKKGNTILHLAARLPPSDRLTTVKGVVRQLSMEWWWFKEVKKILHPTLVEAKNNKRKTAQAIFTEQHKKMMSDAEKWVKDTSNSMLMAATIITTITFAAIFQLPGGTDQKRGISNLAGHPSLMAFVVSDSISLMLSCLSMGMFLIVSQWEFQGNDYDRFLPRQLFTGSITFFYSIIAMFVAFFIAIGILLNQRTVWNLLGIGFWLFCLVVAYIRTKVIDYMTMLLPYAHDHRYPSHVGLHFSVPRTKIGKGKCNIL